MPRTLALILVAGIPACTPAAPPPDPVPIPPPQPAKQPPTIPESASSPTGTPNAIKCGSSRCDLGSQLCVLYENRCVSIDAPPDGSYAACDELADCPEGQRCCETLPAGEPGGPVAVKCQPECPGSERCVEGGECGGSFRCDLGPSGEHECMSTLPKQCGDVVCQGAESICGWDPLEKIGRCTARHSVDVSPVTFECFSPTDCEGGHCCRTHAGTHCSTHCDFLESRLCDTKTDCAPTHFDPILPPDEGTLTLTGCTHDETLPPAAKGCQYATPE